MNALGKISRSNLDRVVLPDEETPEIPMMRALGSESDSVSAMSVGDLWGVLLRALGVSAAAEGFDRNGRGEWL